MALTNAFTQKVDRVADINATKLTWNLVVRVVRLYEIPSSWNPTDGDRIHCSIPKANVVVFKTIVREFRIYSMRNFIVQPNLKGVRTTSHKFKLSFYMKTSVSALSSETFQLNPFRFVSFMEIEAIDVVNLNILLDCIGHAVGKEDARPMVTKSGQESKCMSLDLEDLEYRLNVVVTDGTRCINIMLWNQEAKIILGKSANDIRDLMKDANENACLKAFEPIIDKKFLFKLSISHKNLTSMDQAYNAIKISDDEALISLYSSHSSSINIGGVEQGLSNVVSTTKSNDLNSNGNGAAIISLSKDSGTESIFESGLDTPGKCVIVDSAPSLGVSGLTNPEGQGSSNKTFKHGSTKRKIE
ncbi:hypothetical protein AHAS_Ahas18G0234600 [Arachis hypogaea]